MDLSARDRENPGLQFALLPIDRQAYAIVARCRLSQDVVVPRPRGVRGVTERGDTVDQGVEHGTVSVCCSGGVRKALSR